VNRLAEGVLHRASVDVVEARKVLRREVLESLLVLEGLEVGDGVFRRPLLGLQRLMFL